MTKNLPANSGDTRDTGWVPGSERSPGVENGNSLVFLPGKFYGQRSLVGYSPWGRKVLDKTEQLSINTQFYIYMNQQPVRTRH